MKVFNRTNLTWLVCIVLAFVLVELGVNFGVISPVMQQTLVNIMINIMLAVGLNLIVGFSGQLALGHAGFMAIGAYATGIMTRQNPNFPTFLFSVLVGVLVAGLIAFLVGYPTLRLKGDYLAIATLGVSEIIRVAILNMEDLTNGAAGLSGIPIHLMNWRTAMIFAILVVITVSNYVNSSKGRATIAVREDEIATESLGINTTKVKVIAFVIGAMTAAVAGSVHATYLGVINPSQFNFDRSIDVLITVVFGGIGSITGSVIAGFILGFINLYLQQFGSLRMIIYAIALIIIMIFKPSGLMGGREFSMTRLLKRPQDQPGFIRQLKDKD